MPTHAPPCPQAARRAKLALRSPLLFKPTICSATCPWLNKSNVGMARIPYSVANGCCSSMFTFPILMRPWNSSANSSRIGAIILQGPHHSAQKSTSTGVDDCKTSAGKFCCVKGTMLGDAIENAKCDCSSEMDRSAHQLKLLLLWQSPNEVSR